MKQYRYYDKTTCGFDEKGALEVLISIDDTTVIRIFLSGYCQDP